MKGNSKYKNRIKTRIREIEKLILKFVVGYTVIGLLGLFIPLGFLPKAGRRFHGRVTETLPEMIGTFNYILIVLIIMALSVGFIIYEYKYLELKKDFNDLKTKFFKSTLNKIFLTENDLGENIYKIWVSYNKYDLKQIKINSTLEIDAIMAIGAKVEVEISSNAMYPLNIIEIGNDSEMSIENINEIITILNTKKKD